MAPTPVRHPLRDDLARRRAIAAHPAGRGRERALVRARTRVPVPAAAAPAAAAPAAAAPAAAAPAAAAPVAPAPPRDDEDGSMTTEYGLIVVVGATICSLVIKWASGGAVFDLLGSVLEAAKGLVGV